MDVTSVVRRLRAEPLSPRVQPTYAASAEGARSPMGRTASAPVAGAHRGPASPTAPSEPSPGWALGARAGMARVAAAHAGGSGGGSGSGGSDAPGGKPEACVAAPPRAPQAFANPFAAASSPSEPACSLGAAARNAVAGGGCVSAGSCVAPEAPSGGWPSGGDLRAALAQGACGGAGGASAVGEGARQPCSAACSGCLNCVGIKVPLQSQSPLPTKNFLRGGTSMSGLGHARGLRFTCRAADMPMNEWY